MSDKASEYLRVSTTAEASGLVKQIGGEGRTKEILRQAHRRLQTWTRNRVRDVYHADPRIRISAEEMDQLRAATRAKEIDDARNEFKIMSERIARIEAALAARAADEAFEAYPAAVMAAGKVHRTLD